MKQDLVNGTSPVRIGGSRHFVNGELQPPWCLNGWGLQTIAGDGSRHYSPPNRSTQTERADQKIRALNKRITAGNQVAGGKTWAETVLAEARAKREGTNVVPFPRRVLEDVEALAV